MRAHQRLARLPGGPAESSEASVETSVVDPSFVDFCGVDADDKEVALEDAEAAETGVETGVDGPGRLRTGLFAGS